MIVKCKDCGKIYDDAVKWTICPHNLLEAGVDGKGYCKKHDFYTPCPVCVRESESKAVKGM